MQTRGSQEARRVGRHRAPSTTRAPTGPSERPPSRVQCIPRPRPNRGERRWERKKADGRQARARWGRVRSGPARLTPAGIVCAGRAPSPAPHGPTTHPIRSPRSARAFVHIRPAKPASRPPPPRMCARSRPGTAARAGGADTHCRPRGGARPADSFPTRASPSGETGAGRGGREEMGAPLGGPSGP